MRYQIQNCISWRYGSRQNIRHLKICQRLVLKRKQCNTTYMQPTIGIDFLCRNMTIDKKTFRLQLWDTAGQEKYKSLVPAYLRDANCAIFVVDITRM